MATQSALPFSSNNPEDFRRQLAMSLAKSGMDTSPLQSHWQGAARLAQALMGGLEMRDITQQEEADRALRLNHPLLRGAASEAPPSAPALAAALDPSRAITAAPRPASAPPIETAPVAPPAVSSAPANFADRFDAVNSAPAPQPMPRPMPQAPGPVRVASADPRGFRNNNPLNIDAGQFTQRQPGFQGSDGRFARFENMDQGVGAASNLLDVYARQHGLNTVAGIIGRWAPANDGNNVSAYAGHVARAMGVDPNAPLDMNNPQVKQGLIAAMAHFENGRPLPQGGTAPQQVAQASAGGPPAGWQPAPREAQQVQQPTPQQPGQPPARTPVNIPPEQAAYIRQLLQSRSRENQALGMQMLNQYGGPEEFKFQVAGDQLYRTSGRTGRAEAVGAAMKPTTVGRDQRLVGADGRIIVGPEEERTVTVKLGNGQEVTAIREANGSLRIPEVQGASALPPKLSEGERDEIIKADDAALTGRSALDAIRMARSINGKAFEGWGAQERAWLARNLPSWVPGNDRAGGVATTQMTTLVTEQALNSLKAIFGGNPTEGERKILVDLQASVSKSAAEREVILQRAEEMAQRRLALSAERGQAIRSGQYYRPNFTPGSQSPAMPQAQQPVRVTSPQEAARLPRGTPIILPDGSPGVVP